MKIIIGARQSGKTTELIKQSASEDLYIVCMNRCCVDHIMMIARHLNLQIPMPITFEDFLHKRYYGRGIKGFLIDDLDMLLYHMSMVPIKTVSMSTNKGLI